MLSSVPSHALAAIGAAVAVGFGAAVYVSKSQAGSAAKPKKEQVASDKAPEAIGPFSQAIRHGNTVYVSGCVGMDPSTRTLASGLEAQTHQVLKNLKAIVEASGSSLDNVVKVTVFLRDMQNYKAVNAIYAEYFKSPAPARSCFAVVGLPLDALVEMECVAALTD